MRLLLLFLFLSCELRQEVEYSGHVYTKTLYELTRTIYKTQYVGTLITPFYEKEGEFIIIKGGDIFVVADFENDYCSVKVNTDTYKHVIIRGNCEVSFVIPAENGILIKFKQTPIYVRSYPCILRNMCGRWYILTE